MPNKLFDLTGKTALITGSSSGLGESFAKFLSNAGARVILVARGLDKLQNLADELKNAIAIKMDISDEKSVHQAFEQIEKFNEKIDICVNNAGDFGLTPIFEQEKSDTFENIIKTNVLGTWYLTKSVAII